MLSLTNHRHASSLTSSAIHRWFRRISLFIFELVTSEVIFAHQNLISNCLSYVKSTDELISFGFSDRSSEVWSQRNAQLIPESKQKRLHFLADLWSQSEFTTQRKSNPKSEMTRCPVTVYKCTMQLKNYFQVKPGRKILSFLYISFFCSWLCVLSFMANKRRLSIYQTSGSIKRCTEKGCICPIIGELWSEPNTRSTETICATKSAHISSVEPSKLTRRERHARRVIDCRAASAFRPGVNWTQMRLEEEIKVSEWAALMIVGTQ